MNSGCNCNCHSLDKLNCGCCSGGQILTPSPIANPPGLYSLGYRIGTHASFLETMKARLGDSNFPALKNLKTRDAKDPSIAFLDAWATVADVLTFYQERIANEGYLRTAIERRSLMELGNLVKYTSSPGVSASVYLAFTLEDGYNLEIPTLTQVQSQPTADQLPQIFETSETLQARAQLNILKPRMAQPQRITLKSANPEATDATRIDKLYLEGMRTNLKPQNLLLLIFGDSERQQVLRRVQRIELQEANNLTQVILQPLISTTPQSVSTATIVQTEPQIGSAPEQSYSSRTLTIGEKIARILMPPSKQPANALELKRTNEEIFNPKKVDIAPSLIKTLKPDVGSAIYQVLAGNCTAGELQQIQALDIKVAPFGHNVGLKPVINNNGQFDNLFEEWQIAGVENNKLRPELQNILALDTEYDQMLPGSWVAIDRADKNELNIYRIEKVETITKTDYGFVARVTQLTLDRPWLNEDDISLAILRQAT